MVRAVRQKFAFQRHAGVIAVAAAVARRRAGKIVTAVQLQRRCSGENVHFQPAVRRAQPRRRFIQRQTVALQQIGVIVTLHPLLGGITQQILRQCFRLAEIHAAAVDRRQRRAGDPLLIDRQVMIRVELQRLLTRVLSGAVQIEIGMVGQVDRAGTIGLRLVVDLQLVVVRQAEAGADLQIAGEALIAVGRMQLIRYLLPILLGNVPAAGVEALRPAVQLVRPLIGQQRQRAAVLRQAGVGDAVGVAAYRSAEIGACRR